MSVIIIGSEGYVGRHVAKLFYKIDDVYLYDKKWDNCGVDEYKGKYDFGIICVPTPMSADGSCDISMVEDVIQNWNCDLFIIKSTIAPGTTDYLEQKYKKNIVFSPEYVGSSSVEPALDDMSKQPFVIFGGRPECTQKAVDLWQKVRNSNIKTMQCSAVEAEIIKYMENTFIATKVTFCNEFYNICKAFGVDYHRVREGFLLDPRMSRYFSFVYPDNRGWGGHCIKKDLESIIHASTKQGYAPMFLWDVVKNNERIKNADK